MRFLHAADLHIDSPLRGLDVHAGAPVERLRGATRRAAAAMVDLALQRQVDFVVLAGDIFDGPWPDMRTGIWTAQQLGRLAAAKVPVYMLRGNHDAQSKVRQAVTWPDNVHEFPVDQPHTFELPECRAALHGQGFATPQINIDLAANYPPALPGWFNIGVLHTSLTGDPQHDTYAPTTEDVLRSKGYDYWALGHVHQRRMIRQREPCIAFSGNTQGRHVRETGAKGCLIAEVVDNQLADVAFHETDCLRWQPLTLSLQGEDSLQTLQEAARLAFADALRESDGRFVVARLTVQGACQAHRQLASPADRDRADADLRSLAAQFPDLWIEKIRFETSPPIDLHALRQGQDLLGELLRDLQLVCDDADQSDMLAGVLSPLAQRSPAILQEAGLELESPEQLRRWLAQAEGMLVALMDSEADG